MPPQKERDDNDELEHDYTMGYPGEGPRCKNAPWCPYMSTWNGKEDQACCLLCLKGFPCRRDSEGNPRHPACPEDNGDPPPPKSGLVTFCGYVMVVGTMAAAANVPPPADGPPAADAAIMDVTTGPGVPSSDVPMNNPDPTVDSNDAVDPSLEQLRCYAQKAEEQARSSLAHAEEDSLQERGKQRC